MTFITLIACLTATVAFVYLAYFWDPLRAHKTINKRPKENTMIEQLRITREMLLKWDFRYFKEYESFDDNEEINALVPPEGLTLLEFCELDISTADKLCVLLRKEILPVRELRLLACKWAERVIEIVDDPDKILAHAILMARRYAVGAVTEIRMVAAGDRARKLIQTKQGREWHAAIAAWSTTGSYAPISIKHTIIFALESMEPCERAQELQNLWQDINSIHFARRRN